MQNHHWIVLIGLILLSWQNVYAEQEPTRSSDTLRKSRFLKESPASVMQDVKFNDLSQTEDQFRVSHYYQRINEDGQSGWMQSSAQMIMYTRYLRFSLNADQGLLFQRTNGLSATKITHRFGIQIDQVSLNKDSNYFGIMGASGSQFAQFLFVGGYSWTLAPQLNACVELQGANYGELNNFFSIRPMLVKNYLSHQLSFKPSFSYSEKWQVNLALTDKFFIQDNSGYVLVGAGTGYSLDRNVIVSFSNLQTRRYWFLGESCLVLTGGRISILPQIGMDFIRGTQGNYYLSPGVQLGLRFTY